MSTEFAPHLRKAGQPVHPAPKPALTLVQSTTPRLPASSEVSDEIKEILGKMIGKKRQVMRDPNTPYAV